MALNVSEIQTVEHDVLVVGAGGAGLRAAIEASVQGLSTGMVCKSLLGKAHTVMAEGGIAAALGNVDSRDNWKIHFRDTMRGGKFLNDWRMAELHAKEAPERVRELEEWGAVFDRTKEGLISQRNFGGHRYPRLAHVGDRTGLEMIRTLQDYGVHRGISVYMECTGLELLTDAGRIAGMLGYWRESGRFVVFRAKAVVLATGGAGKAWRITSNSWEYSGDGYAMAYEAGAELMDMEFTQFHPTGMVWPPSIRGALVTESVRGDGGILLNNLGKRFMFGYIPEKFAPETAASEEEANRWLKGDKSARRPPELLTRDEVARAITAEVKAGRGSPHGGVLLDVASRLPADVIKRKLPSMYHQFKELAEVDITKEPMEVGPTLHYFMGGIRVDADTQQSTTVPGLFAAGECGGGMHGANRLGGNSLSDLLVFGKRAGRFAAEFAKQNAAGKINDDQVESLARWALEPFERGASRGSTSESPYRVQHDLQEKMQDLVGIVRTEAEMQRALEEIASLRARARRVSVDGNREFNMAWHTALDLANLLTVSEAITRAAIERKESRGGHFREDYSEKAKSFGDVNIVIRRGREGEMQV